MKFSLCSFETRAHQQLDRVRTVINQERKLLLLGLGEILQDPFGRVHAPRRAPDASTNSQVVFGAHGFGDIAQAVVAAFSPTTFEFDGVKRNIDLIVYHDQILDSDSEELCSVRYRATGKVHVNHRFGQHDPWTANAHASFNNLRPRRVGFEFRADPVGQLIEHHLPDIVSIASVAGPGIPESGYEPSAITHDA